MNAIARLSVRWWWAVIAAWVVLAIGLQLLAPPFGAVATFDESAFLPADTPAVEGGRLLEEGWPDDSFTRTATVALVREDGELTDADRAYAEELVGWLESDEAPEPLGPVTTHLRQPDLADALTSPDGHVMLVVVGLEIPPFTPRANEAVEAVRGHIHEATQPPERLEVYVTGAAAVAADQTAAIDASVARAHLITIALVVLILLWVFRSPVAPLVPLTTIGIAFITSLSVVALLARAGMDVSSMYETFSIVIVFGAGTDYCLLLVARYREDLAGAAGGGAVDAALRRRTLVGTVAVLGGVIASSAATVIVGFSSQAVAQFGLYRTIGPAMAIAVAITLIAGLTLTPALMRLFGRALFWPRGVRGEPTVGAEEEAGSDRRVSGREEEEEARERVPVVVGGGR